MRASHRVSGLVQRIFCSQIKLIAQNARAIKPAIFSSLTKGHLINMLPTKQNLDTSSVVTGEVISSTDVGVWLSVTGAKEKYVTAPLSENSFRPGHKVVIGGFETDKGFQAAIIKNMTTGETSSYLDESANLGYVAIALIVILTQIRVAAVMIIPIVNLIFGLAVLGDLIKGTIEYGVAGKFGKCIVYILFPLPLIVGLWAWMTDYNPRATFVHVILGSYGYVWVLVAPPLAWLCGAVLTVKGGQTVHRRLQSKLKTEMVKAETVATQSASN